MLNRFVATIGPSDGCADSAGALPDEPPGYLMISQTHRSPAADARRALAADPDKLTKLESALKGDEPEAAPATSAAAPPAAQAAMPQHDVADMVARLAARLKQTGSDPEGWLMLTRSYVTLGQKDKAAGAIRDARQALAGDPDKLVQFDDSIRRFNLEGGLHR